MRRFAKKCDVSRLSGWRTFPLAGGEQFLHVAQAAAKKNFLNPRAVRKS
jgi:hypothetical protein